MSGKEKVQSKKRQLSLLSMGFGKKAKPSDTEDPTVGTDNDKDFPGPFVPRPSCSSSPKFSPDSEESEKPASPCPDSKMDIGFFLHMPRLSDGDKKFILADLINYDSNFKFPTTKISDKNRAFQGRFLDEYPWLAYSKAKDSAFCKTCLVFCKDSVGKGLHQTPSCLATSGFRKWNKSDKYFQKHSKNSYHLDAMLFAQNFMKIYSGQSKSITETFTSHRAKEIESNRASLKRIIQIIKFCGRQNIPLRGHDDSGRIMLQSPSSNDGNFRALIRLLANSGDKILLEHLESASSNAMYTSPRIQNEIIEITGHLIQQRIVARIQAAKFFSVLADETTDISNVEQLTICLRYVYKSDLREDFLAFVPVTDLSGEGLADAVLGSLLSLGLDLSNLRGQSYDGAAAMSGRIKGVKSRVLEKYPLAVYTYCASHCLNLVISDSCAQRNIRNLIGIIKEVCTYFGRSAIRQSYLKKFIKESELNSKVQDLIQLCETRWVERHEALIRFGTLVPSIVKALEYIESQANDSESRSKSHCLQKAILSFETLISLQCAIKLFSLSLPLSRALQGKEADLRLCYEQVANLTASVTYIRTNVEMEFNSLYKKAVDLADNLEVEVKIPRICKKQTHRQNIAATCPEEYYRKNIFIPFLEEFLSSILSRFENHNSNVCPLLNLLPLYIKDSKISELKEIYTFYQKDLCCEFEILEGEYNLWKSMWESRMLKDLPRTGLEALDSIESNYLPNIATLLKIFCTLPVTTATAERSFSTLRRLKSYLRNTMCEERLVGLALLNSHYNEDIDDNVIVDEFKKSNRKIVL